MNNKLEYKENLKEIHRKRKQSACLFDGKLKTSENHAISKSGYLKRISINNKVCVFDIEKGDFYKIGKKLSLKNIKNANKYRVFSSKYDDFLFSEIENNKSFNENNKEQLFQFAFRAFVFEYSKELMKDGLCLVNGYLEGVSQYDLLKKSTELKYFKESYENKNWEIVEHRVIRIKRKINFISSCFIVPIVDISNKVLIFSNIIDDIAFNVFPDNDGSVILISFLKKSRKKTYQYVDKLTYYLKNKEKIATKYLTKILLSSDHNITFSPQYIDNLSELNKSYLYYYSNYFRNNQGNFKPFIKIFKYKYANKEFDLFD